MNGLYSLFDRNPIKEYETLELEQQLLTNVNVQFSYYPISTRETQRKDGIIHSVYRGNTNRPNITLNNKEYFPTYYQASELYIYGNPLHQGEHSAELVIKHEPTSSSITPLYVCIFLHKKHRGIKYPKYKTTPKVAQKTHESRKNEESQPNENERITGANSVGDDRIFRNGMTENERIACAIRSGDERSRENQGFPTNYRNFLNENERITGANSVGDDRIFRNGMTENEESQQSQQSEQNQQGATPPANHKHVIRSKFTKHSIEVSNVPIESYESPSNQLRQIIESDESVEIDLSKFLQPYQILVHGKERDDLPVKWRIYTSTCRGSSGNDRIFLNATNENKCYVVLIDSPVYVDSFTFDKIPRGRIVEAPFVTYDMPNTSNINSKITERAMHVKEGFVTTGEGGLALGTNGDNVMTCEVIDDNVNENREINFYQMPLGGATNKSEERINTLLAALYLVIGATLVAATMILAPMGFDELANRWKFVKDNLKPTAYFISWLFFFTPGIICIAIGSVRLDTLLITVGVGLFIFGILILVGILTMSKQINNALGGKSVISSPP
jgi:hypothetical protein